MTFDQFFRILKARWLLTLSIVALLVIVTLVVCLILPKSYKATATVMIDLKPDPVSSNSGGGPTMGMVATQIDIIKSPTVAMRVAKQVGMEASPDVVRQWKDATDGGRGDYLAWVGELIGRNLDVEPSRESNIIKITYSSVDPKFAAAMANTFAKAYMDSSTQLRVDPARQYYSFFEERARLAREKLENAQLKLAQAQKERGIVATDERLDAENARLNEMSSHIAALRAAAADARFRSEKSLQGNADQMQDIINNSVIASLKTDLSRSEARLEELSSRFGDAYPAVQESKANIASIKERIASETRRLSKSLGINNSMAGTREAEAVSAYEAQREKVLKLKEARSELSVLEREIDIAQRVYESILARQSQMGLESSNNQNSVVMVTAATEPSSHYTPRIPLALFLAFSVGTLIAVIVVMGLEMFDRRIRGIQDLIQGTGLPVVGVLPNPGSSTKWSDRLRLKGKPPGLGGMPLIGSSSPGFDVGRSIKA